MQTCIYTGVMGVMSVRVPTLDTPAHLADLFLGILVVRLALNLRHVR